MWEAVTPLVDEPAQQAYWHDFKVGDRVRVRLSGECRTTGPGVRVEQPNLVVEGILHPDWVDGVEGTVGTCPHSKCDGFNGHHIVVLYPAPNGMSWMGHFAACELELLGRPS